MIKQDIALTDNLAFFTSFSELHAGALVTLRVDARDEAVDQPFRGLSPDGADIVVSTGGSSQPHRIPHVQRVQLEQTDEGADAAIAMTSDDGMRTEVRFRSPMRADLLDPAVE